MRVCITEKPSVAKDIAKLLGAEVRRDGYFEGRDIRVTWTFGHLCTLKEPADYTESWKRWALSSLPMLPPRFGIKLIDQPSIKKQFKVIESLISEASEVINCGDAGQEGELIQRWVMQKAGIKCPVRRLWISSLTDESIRAGFNELKPEREFDNLYYAGLSRAVGDWILGLNATRLYSLKYSRPGSVLSIGRVQTPTLALVVQRQREIENFRPEDFWELKTLYRQATFNSVKGRYKSESEARQALDAITGLPLCIDSVEKKQARESAPRLFDLTSLQVECNRKWGWTADNTLKLIQTLYEKKVTTYPRVDTTYLSEDLYPKIPDILRRMEPYASVTAPVLAHKIPHVKRVFDNSKVTDHHAIIPTGESPRILSGDEKKLYHLIALRFIAAFYPDCRFDTTSVTAHVDKTGFKASGKVITEPGWRALYASDKDRDNPDGTDDILPEFTVGESGQHTPSLLKKQTQPPKPYTEGTLLRAMESAGKTVEDESLREALKENGIGRPSTRAAIIETLFKRGYIERRRKSIAATDAGIELIDTVKDDLLKSAKLTGIWENKLRRIERGEYSAPEFIDELKAMIKSIVVSVMQDNSMHKIEVRKADPVKPATKRSSEKKQAKEGSGPAKKRIKSIEEIPCPHCGKGHLLKGRTAYGCSRFNEGCAMRLSFEDFPADLTPGKLNSLINKKLKK
ncbi:MAG: DNA topoisomerase 3 [Muribaculaceae bacterium]|nr:DNA topoisomerase 3 [Muribaculaceae bacterium]